MPIAESWDRGQNQPTLWHLSNRVSSRLIHAVSLLLDSVIALLRKKLTQTSIASHLCDDYNICSWIRDATLHQLLLTGLELMHLPPSSLRECGGCSELPSTAWWKHTFTFVRVMVPSNSHAHPRVHPEFAVFYCLNCVSLCINSQRRFTLVLINQSLLGSICFPELCKPAPVSCKPGNLSCANMVSQHGKVSQRQRCLQGCSGCQLSSLEAR